MSIQDTIRGMDLSELERSVRYYRPGTPEHAAISSRINELRGQHFDRAVGRGRSSATMPRQAIGEWLGREPELPDRPFQNPLAVASSPDREGARPGPGMGTAVEEAPESPAPSGAAGQAPRVSLMDTARLGDVQETPPAPPPRPSMAQQVPNVGLEFGLPASLRNINAPQVSTDLPEVKDIKGPEVPQADLKELEAQTATDRNKALLMMGLKMMSAGPKRAFERGTFMDALSEGAQAGLSDWEEQKKRAADARLKINEVRRGERGEQRENVRIDQAQQQAIIDRAAKIATIQTGNSDRDLRARDVALQAQRLIQEGEFKRADLVLKQFELGLRASHDARTGDIQERAVAVQERADARKLTPEQIISRYNELKAAGKNDEADLLLQLYNSSSFNTITTASQRQLSTLATLEASLSRDLSDRSILLSPAEREAKMARLKEIQAKIRQIEAGSRVPGNNPEPSIPSGIKKYNPATGKLE